VEGHVESRKGHAFLRTVFFFAGVLRVDFRWPLLTFLRAFFATFLPVLLALFVVLFALARAFPAASLALSRTTSNPSRTRSITSLAMSSAPTSCAHERSASAMALPSFVVASAPSCHADSPYILLMKQTSWSGRVSFARYTSPCRLRRSWR